MFINSACPNLPGYIPTHDIFRPSWKRISGAKQQKNLEISNEVSTLMYSLLTPRQESIGQSSGAKSLKPISFSTSHQAHKSMFADEITERYQPTYAKLDKKVLRFYGCVKEQVLESAFENFRIRKFDIFYYLEDNTISIVEPKQENSGIPQGNFLNKQKVYKRDSKTILTPLDFKIGSEVEILGRNILICDCDLFTREFYENLQRPQPASIEFPMEVFYMKSTRRQVFKKENIFTDFLDKSLGKGKVTSQVQFLQNDQKVLCIWVLRFFCKTHPVYIIHYYLADDTVEIVELSTPNSGKDSVPKFLKRQKIPKAFALGQPGQSISEGFVSPKDFKPEENFIIYGKKFFISGCDLFTQAYYKENFGIDFPLSSREQTPPKRPEGDLVKAFAKSWAGVAVPPYNGYGPEEVLLGDLYSLTPQRPKKNFQKWNENTHLELKFRGKLISDNSEDNDRRFIITYHLEDDTISIYEDAGNNTGFPRGHFLERAKYKNMYRREQPFSPFDLRVGKPFTINGFSFYLLDCNENTRAWYQQHTI